MKGWIINIFTSLIIDEYSSYRSIKIDFAIFPKVSLFLPENILIYIIICETN